MANNAYTYDHEILHEMVITMENSIDFYDAIRIVRELYFKDDEEIDPFNLRAFHPEIISHAACFAYDVFIYVWEEIECGYVLQAEYFKACHKVIPELMATM